LFYRNYYDKGGAEKSYAVFVMSSCGVKACGNCPVFMLVDVVIRYIHWPHIEVQYKRRH
jgi:hypothetical protein